VRPADQRSRHADDERRRAGGAPVVAASRPPRSLHLRLSGRGIGHRGAPSQRIALSGEAVHAGPAPAGSPAAARERPLKYRPPACENHGMDLVQAVRGCTFDDFLLAPQFSVVDRRDPATIDLSARLTRSLTLQRRIVSANMDTVTRAEMAIVMAQEGGIGIIDRGFRPGDIEPQVREVQKVKRTQHGIIADPLTIAPEATLAEARAMMDRARVGTLVVVDGSWHLRGLLTDRDLRFVDADDQPVSSRMTPLERLAVHTGPISGEAAEKLMAERRVKKLPLIDDKGKLLGLVTARDLLRQRQQPFATLDEQG